MEVERELHHNQHGDQWSVSNNLKDLKDAQPDCWHTAQEEGHVFPTVGRSQGWGEGSAGNLCLLAHTVGNVCFFIHGNPPTAPRAPP